MNIYNKLKLAGAHPTRISDNYVSFEMRDEDSGDMVTTVMDEYENCIVRLSDSIDKIEELPTGNLRIVFSDGDEDEYNIEEGEFERVLRRRRWINSMELESVVAPSSDNDDDDDNNNDNDDNNHDDCKNDDDDIDIEEIIERKLKEREEAKKTPNFSELIKEKIDELTAGNMMIKKLLAFSALSFLVYFCIYIIPLFIPQYRRLIVKLWRFFIR